MSIVDEYLANLGLERRLLLLHICEITKQLVPHAEEALSYGIPAFKYKQWPVIGFLANKTFLSIYPFSGSVIETVKDRLEGFDYSSGSIHFTEDHPLPDDTIKAIITTRLEQLYAKEKQTMGPDSKA